MSLHSHRMRDLKKLALRAAGNAVKQLSADELVLDEDEEFESEEILYIDNVLERLGDSLCERGEE